MLSIDVKERVITVLCSSAGGKTIAVVTSVSSFCPGAQLMPRVSIPRARNNSATFKTSEVRPEREISTGKHPSGMRINSGNSRISDAATALEGFAVRAVMVAAAAWAT